MNEPPRVSVVMVTADHHAPYIGEAVDSVLAQTLPDWELLLVDDGPRGLAGEKISRADPRVVHMPQDHVGVWQLGASYNRGLARARGRYVAILEGDDYWPREKLAVQAAALDTSAAVLSYGVVRHVESDGSPLPGDAPADVVRADAAALTNAPVGRAAIAMAVHWQFVSPAAIVIPRAALERIGGFLQPAYYPAVDYPTVLRLATEGRFVFDDRVVGFSRTHPDRVTRKHVPGRTYLLGMFRCWLETAIATGLRIEGTDAMEIARQWRRRLADHYLIDARHALAAGDRPLAHARLDAVIDSSALSTGRALAKALLLRRVPGGARAFEAAVRAARRPTVEALVRDGRWQESEELVLALEEWLGEIARLSSLIPREGS